MALLTATTWLLFSFHVTVAHPLVDYWHNVSPAHDLSGMTHATCEHEAHSHTSSRAHEESQDSHDTHCHAYHPIAAKTQPKLVPVAPPVFTMGVTTSICLACQRPNVPSPDAVLLEVPPAPLFLSHRSLLI